MIKNQESPAVLMAPIIEATKDVPLERKAEVALRTIIEIGSQCREWVKDVAVNFRLCEGTENPQTVAVEVIAERYVGRTFGEVLRV